MSQDYEECEVIFPYKKVNDDELDLQRGQIVTILNKNLVDPGWWKGVLNGKVGVFPDNFVKIIKTSSDKPPSNKEVEEQYILNSLKDLKKELEESASNDLNSSENNQNDSSVEKENSEKKTSKPKKSSQKKVAPSVPPPVVVTPEKEEIKLVEDEPSVKDILDVIGSSTKLIQQTVGRVKPPGGRRPPSKHLLKENIPDLIDIPVAEEDDDEEEKEEKIEKESPKPKIGFPLPGLGKVDLSSVKLRETKPKNKSLKLVRPATTIEPRPQTLPGWMELTTELGKKQARRSEIFLDKNSPEDLSPTSPLPSQISRSKSFRKPATGGEAKKFTSLKTDYKNDSTEEKRTNKEEDNNARNDMKEVFNKKPEKSNEEVDITSLKKDMETFKKEMLKEISSLKDDLETERKSRQALEKEILELKRRI